MFACLFTTFWITSDRTRFRWPTPFLLIVGFITDFLDTIGIGSFATTTGFYRAAKSVDGQDPANIVDDQDLPGTLNVGHALPTILQAFISITAIEIDPKTLVLLIAASVFGATIGATFVTKLSRDAVRLGMGSALLLAALILFAKIVGWIPKGGEAHELEGTKLLIGLVGNFVFGALMTIGVGAYAPIMIMVSLLGMDQKAAYPIMMGSCAFLMPIASMRFIRSKRYNVQAALGLTLLGLIGVAIASMLVISLSGWFISLLVLAVVLYSSASLLLTKPQTSPEN